MPRFRVLDPSRPESASRRGLPLGPDEILSLDNQLPGGEVPKALAERCSDRRVFVSDPDGFSVEIGLERLDRCVGEVPAGAGIFPRACRPDVGVPRRTGGAWGGRAFAAVPPAVVGLPSPSEAVARPGGAEPAASGRPPDAGAHRLQSGQSQLLRAVRLSAAVHREA